MLYIVFYINFNINNKFSAFYGVNIFSRNDLKLLGTL